MNPAHRNLDWRQPLVITAADELLREADGTPPQLDDTLVIVPTVQSGRRLREALALRAGRGGLIPPRILTPDAFLTRETADRPVASEADQTAAWSLVLRTINPRDYGALFPLMPERSSAWRLGLANRLRTLRAELGEAGIDFSDTYRRLADSANEPERWQQLARLEEHYLDTLRRAGLEDPLRVRREAAESYTPDASVRRIIIAATPDPQPLPVRAWERAAAVLPVEVWTYGPPNEVVFDDWGRPLTETWRRRSLDLEGWGCRFTRLNDAPTTALEAARTVVGGNPGSIALGLGDPELGPVVSDALSRSGISSYDPSGTPLRKAGVGRLADILCGLAETPDATCVRMLLQHPAIHGYLRHKHPRILPQETLLSRLDHLCESRLPPDLRALSGIAEDPADRPGLRTALLELRSLHEGLSKEGAFADKVADTLGKIHANAKVTPATEEGRRWTESATTVRTVLQKERATSEHFPSLGAEIERASLRQSLQSTRTYPDRPKDALDLLGWLELLWQDSPHLVVVGLNEGRVPESVVGDAFLPESVREPLGLRTNAQRFARDAYLLEALCHSRATGRGRVDCFVPAFGVDGAPARPSRLLFLGGPQTFLPRVDRLFGEAVATPAPTARRHPPWRLRPPEGLPFPETLPISALRDYLLCPFRFFLRHILRMRTPQPCLRELDPASFGSRFHDVVSSLADRKLDPSLEPAVLANELQSVAERQIAELYGTCLSFALRLQKTALLARIGIFCHAQSEALKAHGARHIQETEHVVALDMDGFTLRGRIDRIDLTEEGDREVIDYKTSDNPTAPARAHLAALGGKAPPAHLPEDAFFEDGRKTFRWTDLQLPLYCLALRGSGGEAARAAYFNIGKTREKSAFEFWDGLTTDHLDRAEACARAILSRIRAGAFWPPNPDISRDFDDFAPLFPEGIAGSVDPDAFANYRFAEGPGQTHSTPSPTQNP